MDSALIENADSNAQRSGLWTNLFHKSKRLSALAEIAFYTPERHNQIDAAFCINGRGSTLGIEIRAGTTAFLASASNLVVNAHILSHAGLNGKEVVVNGAFVCGLANIASGILSNLPLGLMPGVGPNILLAFALVAKRVCTTEQALAISIMTGICLILSALTPVNKLIIGLVPFSVRYGLLVGTGLLSSLIGLKAVGLVVADSGQNFVALGALDGLEVQISVVFLVLIVSMLYLAVRGAVLIGMLGATVTYWACSGDWPSSLFSPSFPSIHAVDYSILISGEAWTNIVALILMLMLSTCGAVMSSARMSGLMRPDGGVNGGTSVYLCCGMATIISGAFGSAPVFVSMAASAGIHDGGKTGIVSIVVGIYSLLTSFLLSPVVSSIPKCAISPVLLLVGVSLMGEAAHIEWKKIDRALPAFLCAIFQPFTFSVAYGINVGLGTSLVLFVTTGQIIYYMPWLKARLGVKDDPICRQVSNAAGPTSRQVSHATDECLTKRPGQLSFSRQTSRQTSVASDDSVEAMGLRRQFHSLGVGARQQAEDFVDSVSSLLGFDAEAVHQIFEERLETGRNANFTLYQMQGN